MNKKRTIITAVVMFLIIALLIIIIIAVATRKPAGEVRKPGETTEIAIKDHTIKSDVGEENLPPVSNSEESATISTNESSESSSSVSNEGSALEFSEKTEENSKAEKSTEAESTSAQDSSNKGMTSTVIVDTEESNLPHSGPESALPAALLLGTLTTFIVSKIYFREKRYF